MNTNVKRLLVALSIVGLALVLVAMPRVFAATSHVDTYGNEGVQPRCAGTGCSGLVYTPSAGWNSELAGPVFGIGAGGDVLWDQNPGNTTLTISIPGGDVDNHTGYSLDIAMGVCPLGSGLSVTANGGGSAFPLLCDGVGNVSANVGEGGLSGMTTITITTAGTVGVVIDNVTITGVAASGGAAASAVPLCDTRINCFPGTMVPIYCQEDAVEIWSIDPTGVGTLAIRVPYADLLLLPEFPASNITIATHDDIGFYKLSTGELQVNRGPDFEGKVYVFIWNGCPISNGYIRSFNIFDLFVQSTP